MHGLEKHFATRLLTRYAGLDQNTLSKCLLSLVVLATSVATLATTLRFAPLLSVSATTVRINSGLGKRTNELDPLT